MNTIKYYANLLLIPVLFLLVCILEQRRVVSSAIQEVKESILAPKRIYGRAPKPRVRVPRVPDLVD